jgi:ARC6-like, IMS domain
MMKSMIPFSINTKMQKSIFWLFLAMMYGCSSTSTPNASSSAKSGCPSQPQGSLDAQKVKQLSLKDGAITESGQINAGSQQGFSFNAKKGQGFRYKTKDDICVWIYSPTNSLLSSDILPVDGKYTVQVSGLKGSASFTLDLKLRDAGVSPDGISQSEAVALIEKFLASKKFLFAPPYNQELGYEIMTGKAYKDHIKGPSSDGTGESSIEWLRNNKFYYTYGIQQIKKVNKFYASSNNAVIELRILEEVNLYKPNGELDQNASTVGERVVRYSLIKENEVVKISDYNIIDKSSGSRL